MKVYDKLYEIFSERRFKKVKLNTDGHIMYEILSYNGVFNVLSRDMELESFIQKCPDAQYFFNKWNKLSNRRYVQHCKKLLKLIFTHTFVDIQPLTKPNSEIFYLRLDDINGEK